LQRSWLLVTSSNDTCYKNVNIYLDFFKDLKVLGRFNQKPILSPNSGEGRFVWESFFLLDGALLSDEKIRQSGAQAFFQTLAHK
jgi:hypothetical protein